jgi:hypothetical protein
VREAKRLLVVVEKPWIILAVFESAQEVYALKRARHKRRCERVKLEIEKLK